MEIVHSHVYSEYSLLSSTNRIEALVKKAHEDGFQALALCDHHVMYGAVPFYQACMKYNVKPIIGLQLTIQKNENELALIRCYAKNKKGYVNLLKLATIIGHKAGKRAFLKKEEVTPFLSEVIVVIPYSRGPIEEDLVQNQFQKALNWLRGWKGQTSASDWFLEIQQLHDHVSRKHEAIQTFSETSGIQLLASHPCRFLEKQDATAYQVIRAIREGVKAEDYPLEKEERSFYLLTPTEMVERFAEREDALVNTKRFASLCNVQLTLDQQMLPEFPGILNSNELLRSLCDKGCEFRYGTINDVIEARLNKELAVIERMGFSDYFLIVWDFMKYAREKGILTGPGRGSAAGSIVAYVLQITDVDPLQYDLLFERFLNHERVSMPDIDIDFPDHRRDEVIEYVQQKYGKNHVAQILTFGTLAARAVVRDVGKVLGVDSYLIGKLTKQIPVSPGVTLEKALASSKELESMITESKDLAVLWKVSKQLEGLPRHASTHAAGVVISAKPLTELMALQAGQSTISLTQATMDVVEKIGLLKFDFLGLRNLTLLENISFLIEQQYGEKIDYTRIPLDDKKTYQLLGQGDTTGVFQLESDGMRQALTSLQPTEFEDIVAVNALYRPGPMKYIPMYRQGKHEVTKVVFPHEDLEPILKRTYGVIIYQEQIMRVAAVMAGFTLAEADLLRRAISKKKKGELEKQRKAFIRGARQKGYSEQVASDVYELIERFADYGFNRSHAVAYSMISYQLAYVKANYPLAFYTALLSGVWNNDDKLSHHIRECRKAGYDVLPPSISKSHILFSIENEAIRFGLLPIAHVGFRAAKLIVQEREEKRFTDLFSFAVRIDQKIVNKKAVENLIKAGAMDEFHPERATLLYSVEEALRFAAEVNSFQDETEGLFTLDIQAPDYKEIEPLSIQEKLDYEKEALGFYLSGHPIEMYKPMLDANGRLPVQKAKETKGNVRVAGLLSQVRRIKTKKGDAMAFAVVTDESGGSELVIFPRTWDKIKDLVTEGELILVEGRYDHTREQTQLIVEKIDLLKTLTLKKEEEKLFLRISEASQSLDLLEQVKVHLLSNTGTVPVILYYEQTKQTKHLTNEYQVTPDEAFLLKLKEILGERNVILKK
ncbi:DNA polymerase III subunit alpha [Halalkalibacter kiskunsagensis]|uniref:DNA polymerase III subunit alpha n=1 Tax=Halalkalibacter kiskunsagensis TaxID=1548599 RepID=A0ABV6KIW8_9BACI